MLTAVHVLGDYWRPDRDRPTPLGELVSRAKEQGEEGALTELQRQLAIFVGKLDLPPRPLVMAVPPGPDRRAHPVPALAAHVASALDAEPGGIVERDNPTARVRDTPVEERGRVVAAAGYRVAGDVEGRNVVLVDDVILTGTTVGHLADLLVAAGAADVVAVVVCRTRLSGTSTR